MTIPIDHDSTSRTVTVGDIKVHYHEAGAGPVVVMLHGAGPGVSGWSNFGANLPYFAQRFRTLIVDQPGFGGSGRPAFTGDFFSFSARVLRELLDELDIERAHIVGNSLGGGVATRFAIDAEERAGRLALMGPGGLTAHPFIPEPTLGHARLYDFYAPDGQTRDRLATFMRGMVFDPELVTDAMIDERFERSQEPGSFEGFQRMADSFRQPENVEDGQLWRHIQDLEHETLLIWGREDLVNPWDGALFAFSQMRNVRLHVMSRCGHWAQLERAREFNRVVAGFLADEE